MRTFSSHAFAVVVALVAFVALEGCSGPAEESVGTDAAELEVRVMGEAASAIRYPKEHPPKLLGAVWRASPTLAWSTGPDGLSRYDGHAWAPSGLPLTEVTGLFGMANGHVFVASAEGITEVIAGAKSRLYALSSGHRPRSVWARGSSVWVVGDGGAVETLIRDHFEPVTIPFAVVDARAVYGTQRRDLWVGGDLRQGRRHFGLARFDGRRWTHSLDGLIVDRIWGVAANDVWATARDQGGALRFEHWDGWAWHEVTSSPSAAVVWSSEEPDSVVVVDNASTRGPGLPLHVAGIEESRPEALEVHEAFSASDVDAATTIGEATLTRNTVHVTVEGLEGARDVLVAGKNQFRTLWTRDSVYALLGADVSHHREVIEGTLETLLDKQRADGLLPRRIGDKDNVLAQIFGAFRYYPTPGTYYRVVEYGSPRGAISVDSNPLVVWLAATYVRESGNTDFARRYYDRLRAATEWTKTMVSDGLVEQAPYGDWKDLTPRAGKVTYSNVLQYRALTAMAELATVTGHGADITRFQQDAAAASARIHAVLWNASRGIFRDTAESDTFSLDGNLLAIVTGLATPAESRSILDAADRELRTSWGWYRHQDRPYPGISWWVRLIGMAAYGEVTTNSSWLTSLYAMAADAVGDRARADRAIDAVAAIVVRDENFIEDYEADRPEPFERLVYAADRDFSWSAGFFLRAVRHAP